jgi:hypothetical protein
LPEAAGERVSPAQTHLSPPTAGRCAHGWRSGGERRGGREAHLNAKRAEDLGAREGQPPLSSFWRFFAPSLFLVGASREELAGSAVLEVGERPEPENGGEGAKHVRTRSARRSRERAKDSHHHFLLAVLRALAVALRASRSEMACGSGGSRDPERTAWSLRRRGGREEHPIAEDAEEPGARKDSHHFSSFGGSSRPRCFSVCFAFRGASRAQAVLEVRKNGLSLRTAWRARRTPYRRGRGGTGSARRTAPTILWAVLRVLAISRRASRSEVLRQAQAVL